VARCTKCEREDSNHLVNLPIPREYKDAKYNKYKTANGINKCIPESFHKPRDLFEKIRVFDLGPHQYYEKVYGVKLTSLHVVVHEISTSRRWHSRALLRWHDIPPKNIAKRKTHLKFSTTTYRV
jgi:hypothetical protein